MLLLSILAYVVFSILKSQYDYLTTFQGQAKQIATILVIPAILSFLKNTIIVGYIKRILEFFGTYSLEIYVLHMLLIGLLWDVAHYIYGSELPVMSIRIVPLLNLFIVLALCKPIHRITTMLGQRIINC